MGRPDFPVPSIASIPAWIFWFLEEKLWIPEKEERGEGEDQGKRSRVGFHLAQKIQCI